FSRILALGGLRFRMEDRNARKDRPVNERNLFIAALQIEDSARRSAYLDQVCGDDAELRKRVEALMTAFGQAGSFLQQAAADAGATSDVPPLDRRPTAPRPRGRAPSSARTS